MVPDHKSIPVAALPGRTLPVVTALAFVLVKHGRDCRGQGLVDRILCPASQIGCPETEIVPVLAQAVYQASDHRVPVLVARASAGNPVIAAVLPIAAMISRGISTI